MKHVLLFFVCMSSCYVTTQKENQNVESTIQSDQIVVSETQHKPEVIISNIPQATWEKNYFEEINERTNEAGMKPLRKTNLNKEDLEVRVWMGFGITKLEGFTLKRLSNKWSAIYVDADFISKEFINKNIKLEEPKEGWNKVWQKLIDAEILTLPDAESINCNGRGTDGFSYVVELKKGRDYRTYMYENPDTPSLENCREAKQMEELIKIIFQDYKN